MRSSPVARSFPHRPEGDATQEMSAQQYREAQDRDEEQRRRRGDRREVLSAFADNEGYEGRHRLCFAAREQHSESIFVPGKDETEDGGRGDAGGGLRQDDLEKRLKPRVPVDHSGFLVLARYLVDESLEQPHRERDVHSRIEQDHAEMGAAQSELAE